MVRVCSLGMRVIGLCLLPALAAAEPLTIPSSPLKRPHLKSIYSGVHQLADFQRPDTTAIVCVFVGVECPVSKQYLPRLRAIHEEFGPKHVQILGIYADASVNVMSMATHAHENDILFPVLLDQQHRLADLLEVTVVPEVVVLDANWEKRYQGAIDNQFKKRGRLGDASQHYLVDALKQVLAGERVETDYVPASGCPLERNDVIKEAKDLTFHADVEPIIQKHCQSCHRPKGVAPFELTTFADVSNNAEKIQEAVGERRMPPWHGFLNPEFGRLANDKRMSEVEINKLLAWFKSGAVEGDPKDAPAPIKWPDSKGWGIGNPDYVYRIDPPFKVPKSGILEYQFFRVKLDFPTDRWFQAIEIKPGNPEVVHHITLHLVEAGQRTYTGLVGMAALYGLNTQRARLLNDYLPGDTYNAKVHPPGQAVRIPKHSDLIFEIHYTPNNREATTDQSMVAFNWAQELPQEEVLTSVFRRPVGRFRIPPHHPHFRMEDTYYFEHDVELDTIRPHFHLRGKSYRLEIIERNKDTDEIQQRTTVLTVPLYDFNWQRTYELATPLRIRAGTELLATAVFDNSELNPNNPDPSATVYWGEGTADEMFSTRFKYRVVKPESARSSAVANRTGKPPSQTPDNAGP